MTSHSGASHLLRNGKFPRIRENFPLVLERGQSAVMSGTQKGRADDRESRPLARQKTVRFKSRLSDAFASLIEDGERAFGHNGFGSGVFEFFGDRDVGAGGLRRDRSGPAHKVDSVRKIERDQGP